MSHAEATRPRAGDQIETADREQIARALDNEGAYCGECGREPGDCLDSCTACQRILLRYADAVLALIEQPRTPEPTAVSPEWIKAQREAGWPDMHPEDYCHRCGKPNTPSWCASAEDWQTATAAWVAETGREGICCIDCFAQMHEDATDAKTTWIVTPWRGSWEQHTEPAPATTEQIEAAAPEPAPATVEEAAQVIGVERFKATGSTGSNNHAMAEALAAAGMLRTPVTAEQIEAAIKGYWAGHLAERDGRQLHRSAIKAAFEAAGVPVEGSQGDER